VPKHSKVLYPGSFDPLHNGHVEMIDTAARLFDHVVVAAVRNPSKDAFFSLEDREAIMRESLQHLDNVSITTFSGLVVDLARDLGCDFIVRSLRVVTDFEVELQMAQMNMAVSGIDTIFLPPTSAHSFLASRFIREIARFGGDVSSMVPPPVAKRLQERYPR